MDKKKNNPLGEMPINNLLRKFAIPSIIAMLVGAFYNIVDQFFIGRRIGELIGVVHYDTGYRTESVL